MAPTNMMGEDGEMDLDTVAERLRHPRWSTFHAEGVDVWPHLIPPTPADLAKRHPDFKLRPDRTRADRVTAWRLWADRNGSLRLESEDTEDATVILWDGHTQRRFSAGESATSAENPKFYDLGLRPLVDAGVLLEALRLSIAGTGSWQDRTVVELLGTPIPDNEAPPLEGRWADQNFDRSFARLGIGFDEYAVSVDTEKGMVMGTTTRMQSVLLRKTSVDMVKFDVPLGQELFNAR